jgi:hypothetical protein
MTEYLSELGVGGIFAILVLQTVLPYLKERKTASSTPDSTVAACETAEQRLEQVEAQMGTLANSTQQMAAILTKVDPESGAPLVYGSPQRLVAAIGKLGSTIDKLSIKIDHIGR